MESAKAHCLELANELHRKADHNKSEALLSFKFIMAATIISPILILVSDETWLSEWLPSVLTGIASFLTAWLRLRKPETLWSLYRTSQRKIESEIRAYDYNARDYSVSNKDTILIQRVDDIYSNTHMEWLKIVPKQDDMKDNKNDHTQE